MLLQLYDGHGTVEAAFTDPYNLIEKNKDLEMPVPRALMPVGVSAWAAFTPCYVMAWCDSMQWRDGDSAAAFILSSVGLGKAFAVRPALLSPLLVSKEVERSTLDGDSSDDGFEVAQLGGDAGDSSGGEEQEEGHQDEDEPDEESVSQASARSSLPGFEFYDSIQSRITELHGVSATKAMKEVEYLEGLGGKSKRYRPGCRPQGWSSTADDFNKAYTDAVPKSVRERPSDQGLRLKKGL